MCMCVCVCLCDRGKGCVCMYVCVCVCERPKLQKQMWHLAEPNTTALRPQSQQTVYYYTTYWRHFCKHICFIIIHLLWWDSHRTHPVSFHRWISVGLNETQSFLNGVCKQLNWSTHSLLKQLCSIPTHLYWSILITSSPDSILPSPQLFPLSRHDHNRIT